ncbi:MAG TPA: hypothetical protein DG757_09485 [Bacillus sp. (in: Bacteria)]|nr:hypothetical protein [Bacillus sp. (in: firmicutes)]
MKFILSYNKGLFNNPDTIFNHEPKLSFIYWGNLLVNNLMGPTGCNALDTKKSTSILKSYSEAVERRALMAGGYQNKRNEVDYFNLINNTVGKIDVSYTRYSIDKNYFSDTTGTAAHFTSEKVIYKALTELIEKNCLFLFWYGLLGKKVEVDNKDSFHLTLEKEGYKVDVYEIDYFAPFITFVTIVHNGKDFVYSCGVSGNINKYFALKNSILEAYLLFWKNTYQNLVNSLYNDFSKKSHIEFIAHLKNFPNSDTNYNNYKLRDKLAHGNVKDIIKILPEWITEMNVVMLKTTVKRTNKTVLVFSRDLYNHIPLKRAIDLEKTINKKTINLTEQELASLPECMIV